MWRPFAGGGSRSILSLSESFILIFLILFAIFSVYTLRNLPSPHPALQSNALIQTVSSESPSTAPSHDKHPQKIAFLFLSTYGILHEELWKQWLDGHESQYVLRIHCDRGQRCKTSPWVESHLSSVSIPTKWGHKNLTLAWNSLVKETLDSDPFVTRFVYLCGRSVPIQPFKHVYTALMASDAGWFEPMFIDRHMRWGLKYKSQCWIAFHRKLAHALVSKHHFERLESMIDQNAIPWNVLTDEFYPSQVANDEGLMRKDWNRSVMWTWWDHSKGRNPSSPTAFNILESESPIIESIKAAKRVGVLFARKFERSSNIAQFKFHEHYIDGISEETISTTNIPLHPLMPDHRQSQFADQIRSLRPCEYEPHLNCDANS